MIYTIQTCIPTYTLQLLISIITFLFSGKQYNFINIKLKIHFTRIVIDYKYTEVILCSVSQSIDYLDGFISQIVSYNGFMFCFM